MCRYNEHSVPWQQDAVDESTDVQEPAYDDAQTAISIMATTSNSRNQYKELRKKVLYCIFSLSDGWQGWNAFVSR